MSRTRRLGDTCGARQGLPAERYGTLDGYDEERTRWPPQPSKGPGTVVRCADAVWPADDRALVLGLAFLVGQRPRELVPGDLDELVDVERPDRRGARSTLLCVVKVLPAVLADQ
jgi:hypothetical protein